MNDDAIRAIEELRRKDIDASVRYDATALAELCTEDVVMLPPGGRPVRGRAAVRTGLERSREAADEVVEYREDFEETLVFGDHAVEWGWISGAERPRAGGELKRSRYHVMRILKRQPDGSWRVHRSIFGEAGS